MIGNNKIETEKNLFIDSSHIFTVVHIAYFYETYGCKTLLDFEIFNKMYITKVRSR